MLYAIRDLPVGKRARLDGALPPMDGSINSGPMLLLSMVKIEEEEEAPFVILGIFLHGRDEDG